VRLPLAVFWQLSSQRLEQHTAERIRSVRTTPVGAGRASGLM
jgi:hypothetical protein